MPSLISELVEAGDERAALDLLAGDLEGLLGEGLQFDSERGIVTLAGFGINGGNPLPYYEFMDALVTEEVAAIPDVDEATESIVRDLLVCCRDVAM